MRWLAVCAPCELSLFYYFEVFICLGVYILWCLSLFFRFILLVSFLVGLCFGFIVFSLRGLSLCYFFGVIFFLHIFGEYVLFGGYFLRGEFGVIFWKGYFIVFLGGYILLWGLYSLWLCPWAVLFW